MESGRRIETIVPASQSVLVGSLEERATGSTRPNRDRNNALSIAQHPERWQDHFQKRFEDGIGERELRIKPVTGLVQQMGLKFESYYEGEYLNHGQVPATAFIYHLPGEREDCLVKLPATRTMSGLKCSSVRCFVLFLQGFLEV